MEVNKLKEITVRVPKENASFLYFILESNENLCFYSTLESSLKTGYRDVAISIPSAFISNVEGILEQLSQKFPIAFL